MQRPLFPLRMPRVESSLPVRVEVRSRFFSPCPLLALHAIFCLHGAMQWGGRYWCAAVKEAPRRPVPTQRDACQQHTSRGSAHSPMRIDGITSADAFHWAAAATLDRSPLRWRLWPLTRAQQLSRARCLCAINAHVQSRDHTECLYAQCSGCSANRPYSSAAERSSRPIGAATLHHFAVTHRRADLTQWAFEDESTIVLRHTGHLGACGAFSNRHHRSSDGSRYALSLQQLSLRSLLLCA